LPVTGTSHSTRCWPAVQQHVETDIEQRLPALLQKAEQPLLVGQQLVQAAVQLVALHQAEILAQQVRHGTLFIPVAVQPPLAAGVDQPVTDQRLEHIQPARALA